MPADHMGRAIAITGAVVGINVYYVPYGAIAGHTGGYHVKRLAAS